MNNKEKATTMKLDVKPALTPKLRFPEFRGAEEWKAIPLNQLAARSKKKNRDEKIVRVLTNSAEFGVMDQRDYFDKDIATQGKLDGYFVVELGDYVYNPRISTTAPVGPISKNNIATGVMSPLYTVFKFKDRNNDFYTHYFKTTCWHAYMRQVSSTGARHDRMAISSDDFIAMPMPVASPEEQQKIADFLSSLDDLIAGQARKLDVLKTHKKGLAQQLFPREGETEPRLRFPEFQNAGAWEEKQLGDMCVLVRGPFGGSLKKEIFVESGYAVYEQSHAIYGDFTSFRYYIPETKYDELKRFSVMPGDIIMSCSGTMGKFAIVPQGARLGVINQALLKLSVRRGGIPVFLKEVLELPTNQEQLLSQSAGGAIKNVVSVSQIKELELLIPSLPEQQRIVDCLSCLDDLIAAQSAKLEALTTYKKGLMQQLFPSRAEVEA